MSSTTRVRYRKGKAPRWYDRRTGARRHHLGATLKAQEALAAKRLTRALRIGEAMHAAAVQP